MKDRFESARRSVIRRIWACGAFLISHGASGEQVVPRPLPAASGSNVEARATNGSTAIGQINGPVTIYASCSANVTASSPKILLDSGCDPAVKKLLDHELAEIASLQHAPSAKLDAEQITRLLSLVRGQYRSVRVAAIELDASRKTLNVAMRSFEATRSLLVADLANESTAAAMRADVQFAQLNVVEKAAAYRFALSNDPLDELEIYRARVQRASTLANRSSAVAAEAMARFSLGKEAFLTVTSLRLDEVRNQETLAAACGAMEDQLAFVSAITPVSSAGSKRLRPQNSPPQVECAAYVSPPKQ
jgi:hypothetical protein